MLKEHTNRPKRGKELWSSMRGSIQSRSRKTSVTSETETDASDSDSSSFQSISSNHKVEHRRSESFVNKLKVWMGSSPSSPSSTPTTPTKSDIKPLEKKKDSFHSSGDTGIPMNLTNLSLEEGSTLSSKNKSKTSLTIDINAAALTPPSPQSESELCSPISDDEPRILWNSIHQAIDRSDRTALSNLFITRNSSSVLQVLLTFSYSNHDKIYRHESEIIQDADELLGKSVENLNAIQIACMLGDEELGLDILQYVAYESEKMDAKKVLYEFMSRVWGGGNTALHLASFLGMADLVKKLLELGANTNKRNDRKYKPVDCADDDKTRALFMNLFEVVRYPLKRTYSVDEAYARRRREQTAGKTASMGPAGGKKIGLSRVAESSLEVDILSAYQPITATSPNFKYSLINGSSATSPPIDTSTSDPSSEVKRHSVPLRSSRNKKQVSFDPCTLLASNSRLGDLNEVKRLIEESNLDCLTANYQTPHSLLSPLHLAASYCHLALCKYLVSVGADVNIQDAEGWTPLHCATAEGHMEIIQFLLDVEEIDINMVNEDEESVLDVAEDESIREYLEERFQSRDSSSINQRFSQITLNDADVESSTSADERDSTGGRYSTRGPYSMTKSSLQRNRIGCILKTSEVTTHG